MIPERWHIYVVDLEPRVGTKPGNQRPCLAIQPSEFASAGHQSTVVLPLTSQVLGEEAYPLRVAIPADVTALAKASEVMVDQVLAWDNELFKKDLGELPEALQEKVRAALREFLDL
jgi:mRNA interferase MazF